jgi:hypothetical protein
LVLVIEVPLRTAHAQGAPDVILSRVPQGGVQPQVVAQGGVVHLVYLSGDPKVSDVFYVRSTDGGQSWSAPLRVNSQSGSAIEMGTIRGAQLAVGRDGRVFVAWNGSSQAEPRNAAAPLEARKYGTNPMLFSRLNAAGTAFEPQRNLMTRTFNLDGGGSIAADGEGRVYVAWHANDQEGQTEGDRRVFIAVSADDGSTFAPEKPVSSALAGACGCCQLKVLAGNGGQVALLYRSAQEKVNRDTYYLQSSDGGQTFAGGRLHPWQINACPMSSYALIPRGSGKLAAWETEKQVFFAPLDAGGKPGAITPAPGSGPNRKYPALALNKQGAALLAWTEGSAWGRGGKLDFQCLDANGKLVGELQTLDGVPAWSYPAVFARPDGRFAILY